MAKTLTFSIHTRYDKKVAEIVKQLSRNRELSEFLCEALIEKFEQKGNHKNFPISANEIVLSLIDNQDLLQRLPRSELLKIETLHYQNIKVIKKFKEQLDYSEVREFEEGKEKEGV